MWNSQPHKEVFKETFMPIGYKAQNIMTNETSKQFNDMSSGLDMFHNLFLNLLKVITFTNIISKMKTNLILILLCIASFFTFPSCNNLPVDAPFKKGDKLYLAAYEVTDTIFKKRTENFYIKIRPLTNDEVDNMDIELSEKELIKRNLSTWDKSYLIPSGWGANIDSLCKYKTACIGTFIEAVIMTTKTDQGYESSVFYKIKPNSKVFNYDVEYGDPKKIPETYTNDYDELHSYFIEANSVTGEEAKKFRKIQN